MFVNTSRSSDFVFTLRSVLGKLQLIATLATLRTLFCTVVACGVCVTRRGVGRPTKGRHTHRPDEVE